MFCTASNSDINLILVSSPDWNFIQFIHSQRKKVSSAERSLFL